MARLLMPRSKATALLQERIDKPPSIVPARRVTGWVLFLRESEEKEWRDHNRVLLQKMFTTSEFADQYDESVGAIRPVQDRYMDEFDQIRARLCYSIRTQVACLSSIKNQLEQIDQDSGSDWALAKRPTINP
ncbi:MAG: hypothetical protein JOY71_24335, partial [Acetobacteraceae bacterium]|nr:hypothetical protein [Acetobacteraceae bacterium]